MAVACWVNTKFRSVCQYTFWVDTDSQSKWQKHVGEILISEVGGSIRSECILISEVNGSTMLGGYLFPKWVAVYVLGRY